MYSTCLFCHASLGTNEVVEAFPVGRRLAFDAAKGRLWVVCRKCERWNLSPLEERWEAIEACERLYRDTRLRAATDNIGLAKLRDGTELVRIGQPQRPEFAAWRYGDQFGRRRTRNLIIAGAGIATIGAVVAGGMALGVGMSGLWYTLINAARSAVGGSPERVVAKISAPGGIVPVQRKHLGEVRVLADADDRWRLRILGKKKQEVFLTGDDALRAMGLLLPPMNRFGGSRQEVQNAVRRLEDAGGPDAYTQRFFDRGARSARKRARGDGFPVAEVDAQDRLAFEMALHEETERRAMEGELATLEARWKEAEEIAAIADDMFLPRSVGESLDRLKRRG